MQRSFSQHVRLQSERRKILKHFWVIECQNVMLSADQTKKAQREYVHRVASIPLDVRDGIIDKWLSYVKSENLTEFQLWRIQLLK